MQFHILQQNQLKSVGSPFFLERPLRIQQVWPSSVFLDLPLLPLEEQNTLTKAQTVCSMPFSDRLGMRKIAMRTV